MVRAEATPMSRRRGPQRAGGTRQFLAFAVTALAHGVVFAALWFYVHPETLPKPPPVLYLTLERLRPPPPLPEPEIKPPPPPVPLIAEPPEIVIKPVEKPKKPAPAPAPALAVPLPPADTGPPVHYFGSGPGAGSGAGTSTLGSNAGDGIGRLAPSDYDGRVKARIMANKVFPMAAQLKRQECVITYSVTIDRSRHMIAHHIDPCLYPMINEAAEAAIVKAGNAGDFDPPDNGAETRVVHGSLPYHLEIQLPPVPAQR